ncbi:MAG: ABC transporter ATP-binding protein [Candidatus Parcubacteria bacterium]|nr:ABC transporter ATP-binding protein [Burkholderiales bacterium]
MEPALRVEGLGKWFVVNELRHPGRLSEFLGNLLASPFRRRARESVSDPVPEAIWAIKDISFEVPPGQVLGVIGRNGSGKSTLLKILARITAPTEGRATLSGRVGALLEVGTGFHPDLSGRQNILLNGTMLGMTPREIQDCEQAIIDFAEIGDFIDTPVKHYSSGMFMRLAFSVAAHLDAEIMLVDEVLAVGDAAFQDKCKLKIRDIARSGRTILFTSHDMEAVSKICGAAIVLDRGRIAYQGAVGGAVERYRDLMRSPGPAAPA